MTPDLINGLFEMLGGLFILISILKLREDKEVKGISWLHVGFFTGWGFWNLYFYPSLDQWFSFAAGIFLCITNLSYLILLIHYTRNPKDVLLP